MTKNRNKLPDEDIMARWRRAQAVKRHKKIQAKAKEIGCENNLKLAEYLMILEERVDGLYD